MCQRRDWRRHSLQCKKKAKDWEVGAAGWLAGGPAGGPASGAAGAAAGGAASDS